MTSQPDSAPSRQGDREAQALDFARECLAQDTRNEWPGDRGAWVAAHMIYLLTGRGVEHVETLWASGRQVKRRVKWSGRDRRWVRADV